MITNEEARKAIERYQKEHPLPYGTIDVKAISSKEGADIISQTIERIIEHMDEDTELWCICEMAKMYMQGVKPVYPVRQQGEWIVDEENGINSLVTCPFCKERHCCRMNFCGNCGADMRPEVDNETN